MFLTVWFVLQSFEAIFTVLWCRYLQKGDEMLSWQCSPLFLTFVSVYLAYIKETAVPQPRMISPGVIVSRLSFELCNLSRFDSVMLKDIFSQPQQENLYNYDFHWLFFFFAVESTPTSHDCRWIQPWEHLLFLHMPLSLVCVFSLYFFFLILPPIFRNNIVI